MTRHHFGASAGLFAVALLAAVPAQATQITQTQTIGPLTDAKSNLTTGGPYTFLTDSASFNKFDASLGTLNSATLSWAITGLEDGSGNFAGFGKFIFAGQTDEVDFDTISNPGPKNFDFNSSLLLSLASVSGTGSFVEAFSASMQQSGYFPWGGTMSLDLSSISLVYDYTPPGGDPTSPANGVPEPLTLSLFGAGVAGAAAMRRRRTKI